MRVLTGFLLMILIFSVPGAYAFAKKPQGSAPSSAVKKYACPMQCEFSDKAGKCPKCGMDMWEISSSN